MSNLRYAVEVVAGLVPGKPDPEFTKRFVVTAEEWALTSAGDGHQVQNPESPWGQAREYAESLVNPSRVNWVRIEWVWF